MNTLMNLFNEVRSSSDINRLAEEYRTTLKETQSLLCQMRFSLRALAFCIKIFYPES